MKKNQSTQGLSSQFNASESKSNATKYIMENSSRLMTIDTNKIGLQSNRENRVFEFFYLPLCE